MSATVPSSVYSASRPHSAFYDVIIIGAGVIGCAAAYELAKTSLSVLVIEKEADAAFGISSRNSGVVHSGIHYKPGTLRALFDVEGNRMMEELCEHLRVPFSRTGKLTAAADDTETEQLEVLMEQGNANGVPGLQILDHAGMSRLQPGISGKAALYSPTTGIISPYGLTIALGEHARENGAAFRFLHQVTGIERLHGAGSDVRFRIEAQETGTRKVPLSSSGYQETVHFTCSAVINCAGLFSDQIGRMAGIDEYTIYPCRGEYYVLDKRLRDELKLLVYPVPGAHDAGLGIHLTRTVEGNILIGPSNEYIDDPEDTASTREIMALLQQEGQKLLPSLTLKDFIRSFSGIRPKLMPPEIGGYHDFVIEHRKDVPGFIHLTGIESPGLTSAPAIGRYIADLLQEVFPEAWRGPPAAAGHPAADKEPLGQREQTWQPNFINREQEGIYRFPFPVSELSESKGRKRMELLEREPDFGTIMCRCETVSLAEIRPAVRRIAQFGADITFTGIKYRTRAMMGRCQGGFCQPRIASHLAAEGIHPARQWYKGPVSPAFFGSLRIDSRKNEKTSSSAELQSESREKPDVQWDVIVIGGGPAGLAAALEAQNNGAERVMLIERDDRLGGILNQCIHDGFGLQRFQEALTGPEYAWRDIEALQQVCEQSSDEGRGRIAVYSSTFVTEIVSTAGIKARNKDANKTGKDAEYSLQLEIIRKGSVQQLTAPAVVLAMGCRERTAGAVSLPGTRPAGIYTAGAAQRLMNMQNISVGKRVMIIGSGDIGLIMARRLTLEGAQVMGVSEIMPYPGGLERNIHQCLHDFDIPLYLHTRIEQIHGKHRVEGVTICSIDGEALDDSGRNRLFIPCDTVLLSVGLIPENELTRTAGAVLSPVTGGPEVDEHCMTSVPGLFACGNVLHVHDIVDFVTEEACTAGKAAAAWAVQTAGHISQHAAQQISQEFITHPPSSRGPGLVTQPIIPGAGIRYTVPQRFHVHAASSSEHGNRQPQRSFMLSFRVSEPGGAALITVHQDGKQLLRRKRVRVHPSEMIRISVSPRPGVSAPLEVEVRPDA